MKSSYSLIVIIIIILISVFPILLPSSLIRGLRKGRREIKDRDPIPLKWRVIFVILILTAITTFFIIPQYTRARESEKALNCKLNLARIATAINLYARGNNGQCPDEIGKIVPKYINSIPRCPAAGIDTYSKSYTYHVNRGHGGYSFTIFCKGHYHKNLSPDNPLIRR